MIVYHGTSSHFYRSIENEGLKPMANDDYSYVTTDYDTAKNYSKYWAGGLLYEEQKAVEEGAKDMFMMTNLGLILTLDIPHDMLVLDDYNLEKEPNQYKVKGGIDPQFIINIENIYHEEFGENVSEEEYNTNVLAARCKLVGVTDWR